MLLCDGHHRTVVSELEAARLLGLFMKSTAEIGQHSPVERVMRSSQATEKERSQHA
jgi:hypothetical protein